METVAHELLFAQSVKDYYPGILTPEAKAFLTALHQKFDHQRIALLNERRVQQASFDAGNFPTFLSETEHIRQSDWLAAPIPEDLQDRRVEITGPVDRKMVINALNSGAKTFMADFEDSNSPTCTNVLDGQQNLKDAISGSIQYTDAAKGKTYQLNEKTAVLIVRPRGLHLNEKHILINQEEISGSLVDFGLYFFHNAHSLLTKNSALISIYLN